MSSVQAVDQSTTSQQFNSQKLPTT